MSLSQPKAKNPCHKFIEWKSNDAIFTFWDKQAEKNVEVKNPKFIVLDELNTISGWSDAFQCGIYSNEVRSLKEQLNVRSFKGGLTLVGLYNDLKGDIQAAGGKFTKSVYAALVSGNDVELVNFQLKGVGFSGWIEYKGDKQQFGVKVDGFTEGKKGSVKFKIPTFEQCDIPAEAMEKAVLMDKELQIYLKAYLKGNEVHESVQPDAALEKDEIPFP